MAHAAEIMARQWAFSFDGFGAHGHTFVEIYDHRLGKWLFLDPHNNIHALAAASDVPLSALEFRATLLSQCATLRLQRNGAGRLGFVHEEVALDYFRRGAKEWYLWWGNAVFSYYAHPFVRWAGCLSRTLAHVAANLAGVQARMRVYPSPENRAALERMLALRARLRFGIVVAMIVVLLLALQLWSVFA